MIISDLSFDSQETVKHRVAAFLSFADQLYVLNKMPSVTLAVSKINVVYRDLDKPFWSMIRTFHLFKPNLIAPSEIFNPTRGCEKMAFQKYHIIQLHCGYDNATVLIFQAVKASFNFSACLRMKDFCRSHLGSKSTTDMLKQI